MKVLIDPNPPCPNPNCRDGEVWRPGDDEIPGTCPTCDGLMEPVYASVDGDRLERISALLYKEIFVKCDLLEPMPGSRLRRYMADFWHPLTAGKVLKKAKSLQLDGAKIEPWEVMMCLSLRMASGDIVIKNSFIYEAF